MKAIHRIISLLAKQCKCNIIEEKARQSANRKMAGIGVMVTAENIENESVAKAAIVAMQLFERNIARRKYGAGVHRHQYAKKTPENEVI